jgi:hypothetical protein
LPRLFHERLTNLSSANSGDRSIPERIDAVSRCSGVLRICCGNWHFPKGNVMTRIRHSARALLRESARRVWARYQLTPQERHNLRLSHTPVAVVTASLGGHSPRR